MKKYIMRVIKSFSIIHYPLSIFILSLLFFSCNSKYDDENAQKSMISDRLFRVQEAFNMSNWDSIMLNYHPDFYHFGRDYHTQTIVWREKMALYNRMDFEILNIDLFDEFAEVRFLLYYYDNTSVHGPFVEPDTFGDMSYFFYDRGDWLIYGNQRRD